MTCPICSEWKYRSLVTTCPICGAEGGKAELDELAREYTEWLLDRAEDERVFGTPMPKPN